MCSFPSAVCVTFSNASWGFFVSLTHRLPVKSIVEPSLNVARTYTGLEPFPLLVSLSIIGAEGVACEPGATPHEYVTPFL